MPHSSTRSRLRWNIASVSVGKPAIRSAPIAISGRTARARRAAAIAWARLCRRFIRFKIRSSPACSEKCRCGMRRGSSPRSAHKGSSISPGSSEESRSRGSAGTAASSCRDHLAEARRARQIDAIGGQVDPGQHDLANPARGQPPRLGDDGVGRHRPARPARIGNDAKGAAMIAALLHLEIGAGAGRNLREGRHSGARARAREPGIQEHLGCQVGRGGAPCLVSVFLDSGPGSASRPGMTVWIVGIRLGPLSGRYA